MQSQTVHLRSRFKIFKAAKVQKAHRERVEGVTNSGGRMDSCRSCFLRRLDMVNSFWCNNKIYHLVSFGCSRFQFFSSSSSSHRWRQHSQVREQARKARPFVAPRGAGPLARHGTTDGVGWQSETVRQRVWQGDVAFPESVSSVGFRWL